MPLLPRPAQRPAHVRGAPAGGQAHHKVGRADLGGVLGAERFAVFELLLRLPQRRLTAGMVGRHQGPTGAPNVGTTSAASMTPIRPDVPAPK